MHSVASVSEYFLIFLIPLYYYGFSDVLSSVIFAVPSHIVLTPFIHSRLFVIFSPLSKWVKTKTTTLLLMLPPLQGEPLACLFRTITLLNSKLTLNGQSNGRFLTSAFAPVILPNSSGGLYLNHIFIKLSQSTHPSTLLSKLMSKMRPVKKRLHCQKIVCTDAVAENIISTHVASTRLKTNNPTYNIEYSTYKI